MSNAAQYQPMAPSKSACASNAARSTGPCSVTRVLDFGTEAAVDGLSSLPDGCHVSQAKGLYSANGVKHFCRVQPWAWDSFILWRANHPRLSGDIIPIKVEELTLF